MFFCKMVNLFIRDWSKRLSLSAYYAVQLQFYRLVLAKALPNVVGITENISKESACVLVICPLWSLIQDQITDAKFMGLTASLDSVNRNFTCWCGSGEILILIFAKKDLKFNHCLFFFRTLPCVMFLTTNQFADSQGICHIRPSRLEIYCFDLGFTHQIIFCQLL